MLPRARFDVAGRTVFITGAARGIGAATARRLHAAGANVALVGLEPELLEALAERARRPRAAWFEADVTDYEALAARGRRAPSRASARSTSRSPTPASSSSAAWRRRRCEQVERTLEVNLLGVWRTDRAVLDEIVAQPRLPAEHRVAERRRATRR